MIRPLVTVSIPTYNSEPFLGQCLKLLKHQTYKNIEINIIDGGSKDRTVEVARDLGVKNIITCTDALLRAREVGLEVANGQYILLLDSDQILSETTIERAVKIVNKKKLDMLILEEDVYKVETFVEKLFQYDRKLIHSVKNFSPYTGVVLPRFYKTNFLRRAYKRIPKEVIKNVGGQDHAIIYFEAWQLSHKVDLLPDAVRHIEPSSLKQMIKKFYRWGYTSVGARNGKYVPLLKKKERFRTSMFKRGYFMASIASITLLLIKGVPYNAGHFMGRIKKVGS